MDITQLLTSVYASLPELSILGFGLLVLTMDFAFPRMGKSTLAWVSVAGLVGAIILSVPLLGKNQIVYSGGFAVDELSLVFKFVFLISSIGVILTSVTFLERRNLETGEFFALVLFTTAGMMTLVSGVDLVVIYLGLELSSISCYILAGWNVYEKRSSESAIKYFILGATSSAVILYGMSLVYGLTGQINLYAIAKVLQTTSSSDPILIIGMVFIMAGLCFKIAVVPFHMYVPDTYEGAPAPAAAFISGGPKAAAAVALLRIVVLGADVMKVQWAFIFTIMAVITMIVGNFMALKQESVKRMLAYSGISHAGYALIGLVAAGTMKSVGASSMILYFVFYVIASVGAFAVLIPLSGEGGAGETFEDLKGFGKRYPLGAFAMSIFILSMAGIPPTGGFLGKLWVFAAAVKADYTWLAIIGIINSIIAIYYYLRVLVHMYMYPPAEQPATSIWSCWQWELGLGLMAIVTVLMGVFPTYFFDYAVRSVSSLSLM